MSESPGNESVKAPAVAVETAPAATVPTASPTAPTTTPAAPDPYANMSDVDRAALEQWDNILKQLPPDERLAVLNCAGIGYRQVLGASAAPAVQPTPAPKETAASPSDPRDAKLTELEKQLTEFRQRVEEEERRKRALDAAREFYGHVTAVLDSEGPLKEDAEARGLLLRAVIGNFMEHRDRYGDRVPFDARAATKAHVENFRKIVKSMTAAEKRAWLEGKLQAAAETLGESSSGAPPARVQGLTDEQISEGYIGDMLS